MELLSHAVSHPFRLPAQGARFCLWLCHVSNPLKGLGNPLKGLKLMLYHGLPSGSCQTERIKTHTCVSRMPRWLERIMLS